MYQQCSPTEELTLLEVQINLHYCEITLSMQVSYWPIISHFLHSLPPELPTAFSPIQTENRVNICCRNHEGHLSDLTDRTLIDARKIITSPAAKHFDVGRGVCEWITL